MARIDWVEDRLQVWARWKIARTSGVTGYGGFDLAAANGGRSGYVTAAVPLLEVEAAETDAAVDQLQPGGLRLTIQECYCGKGGEADHLDELKCSRAAMYARIDQAHVLLAEHFRAQKVKRQVERDRVEALQRSFPR